MNDMYEKPRHLSRFPSSLFSFIVSSNKSQHLENTSETHQDQLLYSVLLTLGLDESAMPP